LDFRRIVHKEAFEDLFAKSKKFSKLSWKNKRFSKIIDKNGLKKAFI